MVKGKHPHIHTRIYDWFLSVSIYQIYKALISLNNSGKHNAVTLNLGPHAMWIFIFFSSSSCSHLPSKAPEEERKHKQEYEQMVEAAKKKGMDVWYLFEEL